MAILDFVVVTYLLLSITDQFIYLNRKGGCSGKKEKVNQSS